MLTYIYIYTYIYIHIYIYMHFYNIHIYIHLPFFQAGASAAGRALLGKSFRTCKPMRGMDDTMTILE